MNFILKPLPQKPKLIISDKVIKEIFYLHQQCGNTEWSGVLWGEVEGSITDIDNLKVTAIDFSLLDLGEPAYTEYELGLNVLDIYTEKPELMGKKLMSAHSHHILNVFFSGTDMKQLEEQAPFHNYYISAIVNKDCNIIAKLAFVGTEKGSVLTYKDDEGKLITINDSTERNILFTCDFEIVLPSDNTIKLRSLEEAKRLKNTEKQLGFQFIDKKSKQFNQNYQLDLFNHEKPLKRLSISTEEQFLIDLLGYAEDTLAGSIQCLEEELPVIGKKIILTSIEEDIIHIYMEHCDLDQSKELDIQFYQKCCYVFDKHICSLKNEILAIIKTKIVDEQK